MQLLGTIQAGFASPAEEDAADIISLEEFLLGDKEASYMLRVQGDSMRDAGILDGDLVVFERTQACRPGDIVVALIEDGYTLKYLRQEQGRFYLEAANPQYPILYPKDGQILGVVTGSMRSYH
ncbi:MAG: peptidase [Candidatus Pacebacteria bacterium]|nr:peptidase [Candidatus Paceibacterota bacterium]